MPPGLRVWWSRVRGLLGRRALERDVADEVRSHLEMLIEDHVAEGMTPAEARTRARREFGNQLATRDRALDSWRFARLESLVRDLRHGLRGIRRAPAFSAVILLTLALGIGATTAIFSVVYTVLLRPLPYPEPDRLVWIGESAGTADGISVTWGNLLAWEAQSGSFEMMAAYARGANRTLTGEGEPRVTSGWVVSHDFFPLTGWRAAAGRLFTEADDRSGAPPTIVLTHSFWQSALGGADAVGRLLTLDGSAYEVIGVLEPGVEFLDPQVDFYLPTGLFFSGAADRTRHGSIRVVARLAEGRSVEEAKADLDGILARLARADPGPEDDHRAYVLPLSTVVRGDLGSTLWLLMGAVGLVLVLACANVASLLLGRSVVRRREMAIRSAIGAGRGRLVGQLLTETLALAGLGGIVGVGLAHLGLAWLVARGPWGVARLADVAMDMPLLLFAAGLTVLVGLISGTAPVLTRRADVVAALKEGSPSAGAGRAGQRLRGTLVVGEVAITVVLVFASTLLVRSLVTARSAGPGFDVGRLLALELRLPAGTYPSADSRRQFYETLVSRLESHTWVESASAVGCPPTWGDCGDWWYSIVGRPPPARSEVPVGLFDVAQPGAFAVLGVPLRAGREFGPRDRAGPPVAIVNETLASRWWPSPADAIGASIKIGGPYQDGSVVEIVGVVADASQTSPDVPARPEYWLPFASDPHGRMTVLVRTQGEPGAAIPAVRRLVSDLDPTLPVWSLRSFDDVVAGTLATRRFSTWLLTLFAVLALILAAVGVYGVLQQWVSARRSEIAIRMALGAGRSSIFGWVGLHACTLVGVGLGLGLALALGASRWLGAVVFGVSPRDPITLALVVLGVILLAAGAAGLPLTRAIGVDAGRELRRT